MSIIVPDGVFIGVGTAVSGLLIKEGFNVVKWLKARKNGNGMATAALLMDIKGQGAAILSKVSKVEERQGSAEKALAIVETRMDEFRGACVAFDKRIGLNEDRLFDHIKEGG